MRPLPEIRDELSNRAESYVTTELPGLWDAVQRRPALHRKVNALLIDRTIGKIPTRPNPLSTMADYTSWASLTDRTYDGRHLPPAPDGRALPPAEDVAARKLLGRTGFALTGMESGVLELALDLRVDGDAERRAA